MPKRDVLNVQMHFVGIQNAVNFMSWQTNFFGAHTNAQLHALRLRAKKFICFAL